MAPCAACGHRPTGDERLHAYLLSSHHLNDEELEEAAGRIIAGDPIDPPPELLERARAHLSPKASTVEIPRDPDEELDPGKLAGIVAISLVLTPLFGLALWWAWRGERPYAARQALYAALGSGALGTIAWVGMMVAQARG